jgi:hypothetical protein
MRRWARSGAVLTVISRKGPFDPDISDQKVIGELRNEMVILVMGNKRWQL